MPRYRRLRVAGGTYFFTVVTFGRRPILADPEAVALLGRMMREERERRSFRTDAVVVLPDHFHLMMTLPDGDDDYSTRMNQIKGKFTERFGGGPSANAGRRERRMRDVWQLRFWEHLTRSDDEREALANYIHYNPVKHGLVRCPHEWAWSSFHRWVLIGWLEPNWSCSCQAPENPSRSCRRGTTDFERADAVPATYTESDCGFRWGTGPAETERSAAAARSRRAAAARPTWLRLLPIEQ